MMENAEEIFHFLEDFSKRKPKTIPQELNDYLAYVARTGDPVYQWVQVKSLFKEKLLNVITDFYETTPSVEIPPYPNVDPFNYDIMKNSLLERLDSFTSAPFTVQRICELLTFPRKQYNRIDKFMRAVEKNILVVSTREPGAQRPHVEPENGEPMEPIVNGSDNNSEYNVDVEMEDMSWKENAETRQVTEPQPSSSDTHISVDIEARLQIKQDAPMDVQEKTTTQYESVTPPELNVGTDEEKPSEKSVPEATTSAIEENEVRLAETEIPDEPKIDVEKAPEPVKDPLDIPEIKVDDAEMTERRLSAELNKIVEIPPEAPVTENKPILEDKEDKVVEEIQQTTIDESSSDSNIKEEVEPKVISEVSTSSEESSSSSDNTDGNSNSPKTDVEPSLDVQEESSLSDTNLEAEKQPELSKEPELAPEIAKEVEKEIEDPPQIETDNYTISDVKSELPQPPAESSDAKEPESELEQEPKPQPEVKEAVIIEEKIEEEQKPENVATEVTMENKES